MRVPNYVFINEYLTSYSSHKTCFWNSNVDGKSKFSPDSYSRIAGAYVGATLLKSTARRCLYTVQPVEIRNRDLYWEQ